MPPAPYADPPTDDVSQGEHTPPHSPRMVASSSLHHHDHHHGFCCHCCCCDGSGCSHYFLHEAHPKHDPFWTRRGGDIHGRCRRRRPFCRRGRCRYGVLVERPFHRHRFGHLRRLIPCRYPPCPFYRPYLHYRRGAPDVAPHRRRCHPPSRNRPPPPSWLQLQRRMPCRPRRRRQRGFRLRRPPPLLPPRNPRRERLRRDDRPWYRALFGCG
mmetsp:Transcript_41097/g.74101  ORF Transcript_41097/g.74101 Transcript_41097/m.74101 type:complete len:212 (-) Transcript_41097:26-661(-)